MSRPRDAMRRENQWALAGQFGRFALFGAVGTLGHYATLLGLVEGAGADPVLSSTVGFAVGAVINYLLNYQFTFHSRQRHSATLPRFLAVAATGMVMNGLLLDIAVREIGLHYLLGQVIATGVVLVWNFSLNKIWTFAADRGGRAEL